MSDIKMGTKEEVKELKRRLKNKYKPVQSPIVRLINYIKTMLIGSAMLDLYCEQNNKSIRMFPSLNPYYYKLRPVPQK